MNKRPPTFTLLKHIKLLIKTVQEKPSRLHQTCDHNNKKYEVTSGKSTHYLTLMLNMGFTAAIIHVL